MPLSVFYSLTYIFNKPFRSNNKYIDALFLVLGAYISGTSLIGAPLIIAVFANHVDRRKLRDHSVCAVVDIGVH